MNLFRPVLFILIFFHFSCTENNDLSYREKLNDPELFQEVMQNLTNIIVYDIFSPPVASRVFTYTLQLQPTKLSQAITQKNIIVLLAR